MVLGIGIMLVEELSHLTPYFDALDTSKVTTILQIYPIGFVKFGTYQKVEVSDLVVLSDQSCCESQFTMSLDFVSHSAEVLCREDLNFI